MTEPMVTLPEPRPEDDEDVVWGLSTASALWQRGERQDAIVWLRRAAEAATAAGQDFRASELGMYASEIEDKLQQAGDRPSTTPITEFEEVIDEPTIPVTAHASAHPPPPPSIVKSKLPPPPPPSVPHLPSSHPAAPSQFPAQSAAPPSQVPATLDLIQPSPSTASTMPPGTPGSPMSGLMAIASTPHPSSQQPSTVPSPPSVAKPPTRHAVPAPPPSQPTAVPGLRLQPRSIPPAGSPKPTSPPQERMPTSPAIHEHPLAQTLATPGASVAQVTVSQPIIAHASNDEEDGAAAPAPAPSHSGRKKPPRAPILDPWGEEAPPSSRAVVSAQFPTMARERAEEILLSVRARPASTYNEGDDVVTSAAPIEDTLRRGKPGAPAPPSAAARRASEPGHLERAAPIVSKAQPSGAPPAPSTPPVQAAPVSHASPPPVPPTPAPLLQHSSPPPPEAHAQARPPSAPPIAVAPPPVPRTPRPLSSAPAPDFQGPKPISIAPPPSPPRIPTPPPPPKPASVAPPRIPTPPPPPPAEERAYLGDVALDEVDAFADLPPDAQRELARVARVEELGADEEVSGFGAALLLEGDAMVCATLVDAAACRVARASIVPSRGTLAEPVSVRVVVGPNGGKIAVWEQVVIDEALRTCPWVLEELSTRADRLQALAGACIGPLGDVDETFRNMLLERLTLRVAAPHERLAHKGDKLSGIVLVGAGSVDLLGADADSVARPGDFLFPRAVLEGHPSPLDAHAGSAGALLLIGDRQLAQELFVTAPPLVAVLSGEG